MFFTFILFVDGLIAINKPYGVASRSSSLNEIKPPFQKERPSEIFGAVTYTVENSLPFIADKLGYSSLTIVRSPER